MKRSNGKKPPPPGYLAAPDKSDLKAPLMGCGGVAWGLYLQAGQLPHYNFKTHKAAQEV